MTRATITCNELPPELAGEQDEFNGNSPAREAKISDGLKELIDKFEVDIITERLAATNGNRTKAAESLKISRRSLQAKLSKFEIQ